MDDDATTVGRHRATGDGGLDLDEQAPDHDVRAVLRIKPFRQLWLSLGLSSFGDWMGLLAVTALAFQLGGDTVAQASLAVSGVLVLRLAPAIFVGPIAGVAADRLDRKLTMVVGNLARFVLFASIPIVGTLWWLYAATVLIEIVMLFWLPAKDATLPNLLPRNRLEAANQLQLATTYGTAPLAALLYAGLTLVGGALDNVLDVFGGPVEFALYVNALTCLVAAAVIFRLQVPKTTRTPAQRQASFGRTLIDGWGFIGRTPLVRGIVIGMTGAFAAGGFVIGLAQPFVRQLGAGQPGYGLLFGAVFCGLALGMWVGPRLLAEVSRRRLFGLSLVTAGGFLLLLALIPNIVIAALMTLGVGGGAGVAWVTGYTMLGAEVDDQMRGRTFAFVQSGARVVLVAVMALAPLLAGLIGGHTIRFSERTSLSYSAASLTFMLAGVLAIGLGVVSYRQMDDRSGVRLREDLSAAWHRRARQRSSSQERKAGSGFFVALEGGDGAGKSTQAEFLGDWLTSLGHEVVVTREPGATAVGEKLRALLLGDESLGSRAEALLFAADRAHHVDSVIRPALRRGAVVVTDRYVDSSIAYQGAGRKLAADEVATVSRWATEGLVPDLTILLDLPPEVAAARRGGAQDHLEAESTAFHTRVRDSFRLLAARAPDRYLVLDGAEPPEELHRAVQQRLGAVLPLSPRQQAAADEAARQEAERLAQLHEAEVAAHRENDARDEAERARVERERAEAAEEARRVEAARKADAERAAEAERRAEQDRLAAQAQAEADARQAEVDDLARRERENAERRRVEQQAHDRAERAAQDSATATIPAVLDHTAELPVVDADNDAVDVRETPDPDLADELFGFGDEPGRGR